MSSMRNVDADTVAHFGEEWSRFTQSDYLALEPVFELYFSEFPWDDLPAQPVGFDAGCGSGRWARFVAPRVKHLYLVDASASALAVAKSNCRELDNCSFEQSSLDQMPFEDSSMDFGYSLGVLHHIPDTASALRACVRLLKPGAPFLLYVYYALDNRPPVYRSLWRATDAVRRVVSRLPPAAKHAVSDLLAISVYWPAARSAALLERLGVDPRPLPLAAYRALPFSALRTDALDRFGTALEKRFTRAEVVTLCEAAGLERLRFVERGAFWTVVGRRRG